jgi:hypothetical protein
MIVRKRPAALEKKSSPPFAPWRLSRISVTKRPDLTRRPLRFTVVREYPIAYAPEEKPLWVVTVMHGRRSPRVMAAVLRGRE